MPDTVVTQINDLARQYRFFHWHLEFPGIFTVPDDGSADPDTGWTGGFSCVVGNPPWERVKIQDKEFFGNIGRADIERRRHRRDPQEDDRRPGRHRPRPVSGSTAMRCGSPTAPRTCCSRAAATRSPGRATSTPTACSPKPCAPSPGPTGAAGIITPTGLATDKTTAPFFADTLSNNRLYAFYDFENEAKIFRRRAPRIPIRGHDHDRHRAQGQAHTVRLPTPATSPTCRRGGSSWPPTRFSS